MGMLRTSFKVLFTRTHTVATAAQLVSGNVPRAQNKAPWPTSGVAMKDGTTVGRQLILNRFACTNAVYSAACCVPRTTFLAPEVPSCCTDAKSAVMEDIVKSQLQDVAGLLKACHMPRQRCKQGLSGLQEAVSDVQKPAHSPGYNLIRNAQEACGYPAGTRGRRQQEQLAEKMSDCMAMLHNNRQKLINSIQALEKATTELRSSVLSLPLPMSCAHESVPDQPPAHPQQASPGEPSANCSFHDICEGSLVAFAACEGLTEECRLWTMLGREGRLDADPDVLYGINEAVHILGTDLERLFIELFPAGS